MPTYAYKGVSLAGRSVAGVIEADSPRAARARLREREILAGDLQETDTAGQRGRGVARLGRRPGAQELGRTLRQLATLLAAGLPLVDAITSLKNQQLRPRMAATLEAVGADLVEGASFEQAIGRHPAIFPTMYQSMIRAGEASGALDRVLHKIADHAEATARLQGRLRAAMTYPAIMMVVGSGIVAFLLAYVVPRITRVFLEANHALPLPTRILLMLSEMSAAYAPYLLAGAVALSFGLRAYARSKNGRARLERTMFAMPWLGPLLRSVAMARLTQTLSTMISGGMPLVQALDIASSVTGSVLVGEAVDRARAAVAEGESLAANMKQDKLFSPMVVDMIAVGERSGDLDRMLASAAQALDEEVRGQVEMVASLVEPLMVLVMAGFVLFVVLAVLLPVFEMNQLVR